MKKQMLLTVGLLLLPMFVFADDPVCPTASPPCGVEEVISCARANYNTLHPSTQIVSNVDYYNKQLFDVGNQDGFCKEKTITGHYPQGVLAGSLQQTYYDQYCGAQTGTYFSYANFITAANIQNLVTGNSAFGGSGGFACSNDPNLTAAQNAILSTQEVVNFFASEAQETTSALKNYTTDGLYFRYENAALLIANTKTVCPDLNCHTGYYPPNYPGNYVGVYSYNSNPSQTTTYTPYLWLLSDPATSTYYPQYQLATSPMSLYWGPSFVSIPLLPPDPTTSNSQLYKVSNATVTSTYNINDPGVFYPGLYVGMGSLQLTGSTMYFYYGWYQNNIANATPQLSANFDEFVGDPTQGANAGGFLREGVRAFEGSFWYWMYRVIGIYSDGPFVGQLYPSLHQLAMDKNRPACHCAGAVTLMINGGCNDFNKRTLYVNYFSSQDALNLDTKNVNCKQTVKLPGASSTVEINGANCVLVCPAGYTLEKYSCVKSGAEKVTPTLDTPTQNLLAYCQAPMGVY